MWECLDAYDAYVCIPGGVPPPIGPGAAKVAPPNDDAFRLATFVVLATTSGAVPVASVEVICLVTLRPPVIASNSEPKSSSFVPL